MWQAGVRCRRAGGWVPVSPGRRIWDRDGSQRAGGRAVTSVTLCRGGDTGKPGGPAGTRLDRATAAGHSGDSGGHQRGTSFEVCQSHQQVSRKGPLSPQCHPCPPLMDL